MENDRLDMRAEAFGVVSRMFASEPDMQAVDAFLSFDWHSVLETPPSFAALEHCDREAIARENRVEFARLFLGPKKRIAPPYESVYRSGPRHMHGSEARELKAFYQEVGIVQDGTVNEPDDFIGFELQCACYLLTAAMLAHASGDEELRSSVLECYEHLLLRHLAAWIPAFCQDILDARPLPLMAACAQTLDLLVEFETFLAA